VAISSLKTITLSPVGKQKRHVRGDIWKRSTTLVLIKEAKQRITN